jgi:hypothetical protein
MHFRILNEFLEIFFNGGESENNSGVGPHFGPRLPPSQAGSPRDSTCCIGRVGSVPGPNPAPETA